MDYTILDPSIFPGCLFSVRKYIKNMFSSGVNNVLLYGIKRYSYLETDGKCIWNINYTRRSAYMYVLYMTDRDLENKFIADMKDAGAYDKFLSYYAKKYGDGYEEFDWFTPDGEPFKLKY